MSNFYDRYGKFLNTLENPGLDVAEQLTRTAGQGHGKNNDKPTAQVVRNTIKLLDALFAFDKNPSDTTFTVVKEALAQLEMKAVRVNGSPEWIYITPDAILDKEKAKWERISINTQFDLSWHVGSDSRVGCSDEHNGVDGAFRAVGSIVAQGDNIKLVMSNSRHKRTSKKLPNGRYSGDWAHSSETIDYPVMSYLAEKDFAIFNIHGMASRSFGLIVNNRTSNFTKETSSLPTMFGIALAQYFRDSSNKKYIFGGYLPGSIIVDGARKTLSPTVNETSTPDCLYTRAGGVHNTNVIGNLIHNVYAQRNNVNRDKYDSGKSCHIEFGIIRDGRADLRKMTAAIDLAAYWMNNYKEELNPWKVIKTNPDFDMTNYGTLYPFDAKLQAKFTTISTNANPLFSAKLVKAQSDQDDIDVNPVYADCSDDTNAEPENDLAIQPLLLSGGPSATPKQSIEENTLNKKHKAKA